MVKQVRKFSPKREAYHTPRSSAEIRMTYIYTTLTYVFMASCLIKQRGNFTFTLTRYSTILAYYYLQFQHFLLCKDLQNHKTYWNKKKRDLVSTTFAENSVHSEK
jgi:hypothetical protein